MAKRPAAAPVAVKPILQVQDLQVYYGESHALQGVSLTLERGVLSVVGRNGMGKTTLCNTIVGLLRARSGGVRFDGRDISNWEPHEIVRAGVGFVPQGRRLWPSLSVDETLRLSERAGVAGHSWTVDRVYSTFPRLAERRSNGGGQLSGGEQQMLAISRALLSNPRLLVMDEPTEGLAPVIVTQVRDLLLRLSSEEDLSVLVVEQNIGVATSVSDSVAIMVNGRINRIMDAGELAKDRDLQQRLLGVGRHTDDAQSAPQATPAPTSEGEAKLFRVSRTSAEEASPVYRADQLPNRWGVRRASVKCPNGPCSLSPLPSGSGGQLWSSARSTPRAPSCALSATGCGR
jgi:ABC-type branched-subunit amino acid transport system ATPase component